MNHELEIIMKVKLDEMNQYLQANSQTYYN